MVDTTKFYRATRWFGYFGQELGLGAIVQLKGGPNDERLVRLGYFEEVSAGAAKKSVTCRECGVPYADEALRDFHGKHDHQAPPRTEQEAEARDTQREKMVERMAPALHLDRTKGGVLPRRRASAGR